MAKGSPMNFVHLFERVSEPLGFGVRGDSGRDSRTMTYFYYEDPKMMDVMVEDESMKQTLKMIHARMSQQKEQGVRMVPIPRMPDRMPDLTVINHLCPRTANFCYFLPTHKKAFSLLKEIFMREPNPDALFRMACACRDNPMINSQLFVYSLSSCLVSRRDTRHIRVPGHYEIMPDSYCHIDVVRQANKMAHIPESPSGSGPSKHVVMVDQNLTGKGTDPEQRMWYFREDILVNSHHFHWHIVFPTCSPKDPNKEGYRDRRGELFYYMHHSMIARYDAERLCNALPRAKMFNFGNLMLEEGYFGKLSSENSMKQWGTRQAFTRLTDIDRLRDEGLQIRVEELQRWRDRILESIDLGYYVKKDPETGKDTRVRLDEITGIDVLGDILESSATLTPHSQYYGEIGFHNFGHVLVAFSHDPNSRHREQAGVMGDVASAMRDPAFYRWHKYLDNIFDIYKKTLPPYPLDNDGKSKFWLRWNGVEVVPGSFYVKSRDTQQKNLLKTFWDMKDVDLTRGLDFRRDVTSGMNKTPVVGRFTHLNHEPFEYVLRIDNKTNKRVLATIRIFMAPKYDENGDPFQLQEQRTLFFEMDKVPKSLNPGINEVRIYSKDSSVTLRDENGSSFKSIEELYREAKSRPDVVNESQCSCGWPQHLLLPKGTPSGMDFDLFVIVTDGSQDMVNVDRSKGCNSAFSFCGVLDKKYPDARSMGFPFDRVPHNIKNQASVDIIEQCMADMVPVPTLEKYVADIKNSATTKVTIVHENIMKKKEMMNEQVMSPDGRCVRMKDYYQTQETMKNNNGTIQGGQWDNVSQQWQRPSRLDAQQQQERNEFYPNQWAGIGNGRYNGGRRGRESDEDWEHLDGDYYN